MEEHQKAKLIKRIMDAGPLPSLSALAVRVIKLAADDTSSAADLAHIIEKDPGLTTRLLRLVGSVFYSRPGRIGSVSQAVVLLGFKKVRIMALSLSLRDTFPMGNVHGMDYHYFWKASLYRALIAKEFAQLSHLRNVDSEEAFVAGLILEIGMPLLFETLPSNGMKKAFPGGNTPLEVGLAWERENLGIDHRELGSFLLRRWHFPDDVVEPQRFLGVSALQHDSPMIVKIVELARRATEIITGLSTDLYGLQNLAEKHLNLKKEDIGRILSDVFDKVEQLAEQLRIDLDSQADIMEVMENANKALARLSTSMEKSLQGLLDQGRGRSEAFGGALEEGEQRRKEILRNAFDAVAHEIRNPLLAIGGFATRLAADPRKQGRGREYARIIAEESRRLEGILREIMDYCREYRPVFDEEDLGSLVHTVLGELEPLFHEKDIKVELNFSEEVFPAWVDRDGICRVFKEILKSAVSMIGQGPGVIKIFIKPNWETGQIYFEISDTGRAMPKGTLDAVLESNLSSKAFGGGLGLLIARNIIEAHKGAIELEVKKGIGNTVNFFIPMSQPV